MGIQVGGKQRIQETTSFTPHRSLNLYRTDTQTKNDFPSKVGAENPVWTMLNTDASDMYKRSEHVSPRINQFKICDLAFRWGIGTQWLAPSEEGPNGFGNWRNNLQIKVPKNVLLFPENLTWSFGYEHTLEAAWESLKPGFMNMVEGGLEIARAFLGPDQQNPPAGGKFISKFHQVPQWKGTTPVKINSTLKFNFQFGQAGIWSGEHEVVRPIIALAAQFAPNFAASHYIKGPAPTKPTYMVEMMRALGGKAAGAIKEIQENSVSFQAPPAAGAAARLVGEATKLQQAIYDAIDQGIAAAGGQVQVIFVRQGRMTIGPFTCSNISWDFDFSETDEYGFPFKGSISFGGLSSIYVATPDVFTDSFNMTKG